MKYKLKHMKPFKIKLMSALLALTGLSATVQAQEAEQANYDNIMFVKPDTGYAGSQMTLSLQMKNTKPVSGYQCDIQLPRGWKVATNAKGKLLVKLSNDRATAETITNTIGKMQNDSILRILAYTIEGDANGLYTFDRDSGEVATITVNLPTGITSGTYPVLVSEVELTAPTNETIVLRHDTISTMMTIKDAITGINGINLDENAGNVYSVDGMHIKKDGLRRLKKGIYIQNGRKVVVK